MNNRSVSSPSWELPRWWDTATLAVAPRPLSQLHGVDTIAFVSDRRPSFAAALARRFNPGVRILVVAPRAQRGFVTNALNATWADFDAPARRIAAFHELFKQGAPGDHHYHLFCHLRWLVLSATLREKWPPPPSTQQEQRSRLDGAVAMIDDDVLLFESVSHRLREIGAYHPASHAEVVVNGAFIIASVEALSRLAAYLWALYALPERELGRIAWQYGAPMRLADEYTMQAVDWAVHDAFTKFGDGAWERPAEWRATLLHGECASG